MTKYYQVTVIEKFNGEIESETCQYYIKKEDAISAREEILDGFKYEPDDDRGYCYIDELTFNQLKDRITVSEYEKLLHVHIAEPNKRL